MTPFQHAVGFRTSLENSTKHISDPGSGRLACNPFLAFGSCLVVVYLVEILF